MSLSFCFKVFTLNCWGLVHVSNRKSRILAIAEFLASNQFDVVCLQEVWTNRDFNFIREHVKSTLPYSHYFHSGVVGSGICILSKHLIEETFFHQWSVNGYIHKLQHGDWWGGKGVGLCRLKVQHESNIYHVNVFTAHLHAEYNRASDDYQAHRVLQAYDTAQFIMLTSGNADFTVLAGDLNTEPGDLAYRVMLNIAGLNDAYMEAGNISQAQDLYATCESPRNSYTASYLIRQNNLGKRIDYVMYHEGSNVKIDLKSYNLPLPERVPKQSYSYSDHEAILVELSITNVIKSDNNCSNDVARTMLLEESIALCNDALKGINRVKLLYWLGVIFLFIMLTVCLITPPIISILNKCPTVLAIIRGILTALMLFCFLMATLWNRIEMHGVLSGKLAMEVSLRKMKFCKNL